MSNFQTKCEHCGHVITAYIHSLNKGKVLALRRLVDHYEITKSPVVLGDLNLTTSQFTNFCHLQYFDLAKHVPEGWIPTETGKEFIYGKVGVIHPAMVMASKVLDSSHEAWRNYKGERVEVFVFDIDNTAYKKRPEFAAEKSQTLSLFRS